ncbi:M48 family metallopeptidase [Desulfoferrobacter suflitae]|uniref:M48 family metallopeptidase n=1 Tax=Desulfoferrobacter suflitae TaxID=2865782 RepID=UPI002164B7C0|nr:M48 family metallopeptidase [Desulfoferrobacter suflitae]MCK8602778.1 M48 family metallopeptidase [Desulfoferrobacter suflitae]
MNKTAEQAQLTTVQLNLFTVFFVAVYLLQTTVDVVLANLNLRYLERTSNTVPPSLEGFVDGAKLSKINAYTRQRSRVNSAGSATSDVLFLVLILSGAMPALAWLLREHSVPFVLSGLVFFLLPGMILYVIDLPFDYYHTFVVEEKFGFNQTTRRIWLLDQVKSGLLTLFLSSLILALILWIVKNSPTYWWLWGFLAVTLVQVVLAVLYPIVIAPVFNKFSPLEDAQLAMKITELMERSGLKVKKILQMNATLRSRHTNAYFTGLGRTKQIVLFDTLIESHPHDEILAVLAHEMGHYRQRHIPKQLTLFTLCMFAGFFLTHQVIGRPWLSAGFGFAVQEPYVGLFLVGIFWQKAGYFLKPLFMYVSRHFEREADIFAARLVNNAQPLANALKRMAADNLSNLTPHPLYVAFNYSHPPLVERVAALEADAAFPLVA